jgi:hypothetical protein
VKTFGPLGSVFVAKERNADYVHQSDEEITMFKFTPSVAGRIVVAGLAVAAMLASGGCRFFSDQQDVSFSAHEFAPGDKKEVKVKLTARSFEAVDEFRLDFEAPSDVSITPSSIKFIRGKPETETVVIEVKANAAPGARMIKLHATPQAGVLNNWHITVADPAASRDHGSQAPGAENNAATISEP